MIFKKHTKTESSSKEPETLTAAVLSELGSADAATVAIVTAIAGLLGSVAYADRNISPEEEALLQRELEGIVGLTREGAQAIYRTLSKHIVSVSTLERPRFTRALVEYADRDLRLQVLGILVDLAAADGTISLEEVTMLRTITTALGLTQDEYNQLQAGHKDRLASLQ